jgi:pimeloyl-ACP methyl ester carboxylesterase
MVVVAAEVRPLFETMGQGNSVYALDLPGYGMSERLPRAYTVAYMCNAIKLVAQWVSQQHPDRPLQVVGVSLSCEYVARAVSEQPTWFRSVALVRTQRPVCSNDAQQTSACPKQHGSNSDVDAITGGSYAGKHVA